MIVWIACVGFMLTTTVYADNELVAYFLNRLSEFSMEIEASGAQSGFIRIWRGYFIYGAMDIVNQIFGVSVAGVESVSSSVYIPDCRYDGTYLNGIQSLLVIGGLVGLFLFINYLFRIYKKMDIAGQSILVSMITVFFLENMLYTSKMFLYILLALCFMRNSVNYKLIK